MTDPAPPAEATAGAPFAAMLRGALVPSSIAGALAVVVVVVWRGGDALAGGLLGLVVAVAFFASGMFLLSRLVRDASPHAFFAVAMTVYLGQVIGLLLVIIAFDGRGVGRRHGPGRGGAGGDPGLAGVRLPVPANCPDAGVRRAVERAGGAVMTTRPDPWSDVAGGRERPVAYVPFPRVPVTGACAFPEERL